MAIQVRVRSIFCERCGRRFQLTRTAPFISVLRRCTTCHIYTCPSCRTPTTRQCLDCAAGRPPQRPERPTPPTDTGQRRSRRATFPIAAPIGGLLAIVVLAVLTAGPGRPSVAPLGGQVAGERRAAVASPGSPPPSAAPASIVAPPATPTTSPPPTTSPSPSVASSGLPSPTAAPVGSPAATATPSPVAAGPKVVVESAVTRAVPMGVTTRAAIIAVLRNQGVATATMEGSSTRYQLSARDGTPLAAGTFTYVIPSRIAPGARAYAIEVLPALFTTPQSLGTVTVEPEAVAASGPARLLDVSRLAWSRGAGGDLHASGTVTNHTGAIVESPLIAVVFFDADDRPLAILYDLSDVVGLAPGASTDFVTDYPVSVPVKKGAVARVEAIAYDAATTERPS